jgi:hypothetical protein
MLSPIEFSYVIGQLMRVHSEPPRPHRGHSPPLTKSQIQSFLLTLDHPTAWGRCSTLVNRVRPPPSVADMHGLSGSRFVTRGSFPKVTAKSSPLSRLGPSENSC